MAINKRLQGDGWGFYLGHEAAHYMLKSQEMPGGIKRWHKGACGQVIGPDPYAADETMHRCGRCARAVAAHPEWAGPEQPEGIWAIGCDTTVVHWWNYLAEGGGVWVARCGVVRKLVEVGEAAEGVEYKKCAKCQGYLGAPPLESAAPVHLDPGPAQLGYNLALLLRGKNVRDILPVYYALDQGRVDEVLEGITDHLVTHGWDGGHD